VGHEHEHKGAAEPGMGYVLIYRATRVLNLAHGDLMVLGVFVFFQTLVMTGGTLRSPSSSVSLVPPLSML
jgi:branched-subunit amino acid ABC-type transport system permease component